MAGTVVIAVTPNTATWTLRGPGTFNAGVPYTGTGDETILACPTGEYRVFWDEVTDYASPRAQVGTLAEGATLTLTGTYVDDDADEGLLVIVRTMLSECATYQSFVSAVDATEALATIILDIDEDTDANLDANRPCAYVGFGDTETFTRYASGTRDWFHRTGTIEIVLEKDADTVTYPNDPSGAEIAFTKETGPLRREFLALSGTEGYLSVEELTATEPQRSSDIESGGGRDYFIRQYVVRF